MVWGLCNAYNQETSLLFLKSHYSRQFVLTFTHIFTLPNLRRAASWQKIQWFTEHMQKALTRNALHGQHTTQTQSTKRSFLWNKTVFGMQEHSIPPFSSKLLQKEKVFISVTRNISETDASVMAVLLQAYSQCNTKTNTGNQTSGHKMRAWVRGRILISMR